MSTELKPMETAPRDRWVWCEVGGSEPLPLHWHNEFQAWCQSWQGRNDGPDHSPVIWEPKGWYD